MRGQITPDNDQKKYELASLIEKLLEQENFS
jgi:hypothetical protein